MLSDVCNHFSYINRFYILATLGVTEQAKNSFDLSPQKVVTANYLKSVQNYHLRHSDHTYKVSTVYSILKLLSMMTKKCENQAKIELSNL